MSNNVIDFNKIKGPVYTGRPRGIDVRESLGIESFDNDNNDITVIIPPNTYMITSSFFLGLFGPSIRKLGSSESFFKKYRFDASPRFMGLFKEYADRALQQKNLFN